MKKTNIRLLTALLVLVMLVSALPMAALAEETATGSGTPAPSAVPSTPLTPATPVYTATVTVVAYCYDLDICLGSYVDTIHRPTSYGAHNFGAFLSYGGQIYELCSGGGTVDPATGKEFTVVLGYTKHYHSYYKGYDRDFHWEACRCGSTLYYEPHVDPLEAKDSTCTCGYKFSDNADLTYLWMHDMSNQPFFKKDITEYHCQVYAYHNSPDVTYNYQAFDTKATVAEPKEKTLREGMNIYEFTVTAEDKKTTKTYTVYVSKPSTLGYVTVSSEGTLKEGFTTRLEPHVIYLNNTATLTLEAGLGERMAFQANNAKSSQVIIEPVMSRWGVDIFYIKMPAEIAKQMGTTESDLVIKTYFGNIVISSAECEKLAKEGENILFTLSKKDGNSVLAVTADDKEVKNVKIDLTAAEK